MMHILIVDDEADTHFLYNLKLKKIFARQEDFKLISFLNAKECLDYLKSPETPPVDLIMSDLNMPGMDGFEFLQEVRHISKTLPFYIVSAYEAAQFRKRAEALGAQRFFSKPVNFDALNKAMSTDLFK